MRVFAACFLQEDSARELAAGIPDQPGLRRAPPGNLHVTLLFLGNVPAERSAEVRAMVAALPRERLSVRIREVTGFPRPEQALALVARLHEAPRLAEWHGLLAARWPAETGGNFDPHVTLGRYRRARPAPDLRGLAGMSLTLLPPAAYRSETLPEGARYTKLDHGDCAPGNGPRRSR